MQCGRYQLYEYIKVNNLYRCLQEGLILDIEDLQSCLNIAEQAIFTARHSWALDLPYKKDRSSI